MSELTERDKELVAIGASIASNCVPCIAFHVGKARQVGLTDAQIAAAIAVSEEVRAVPANLVVSTARAYLDEKPKDAPATDDDCTPNCGC